VKCPKCGYLGFEAVERCRNCGYEFRLAPAAAVPDLDIRNDAGRVDSIEDLSLLDESLAAATGRTAGDPGRTSGRGRDATDLPAGELPLFGPPIVDDVPLITKASPPRAPLAVRRATPEVPRLRAEPARALTLDLGSPGQAQPDLTPGPGRAVTPIPHPESLEDASLGARAVAVVIDVAILAAIDAMVIYLTTQICAIPVQDLRILPHGPLLLFLLVQNGGYFVAFTAGGQTIGKMAAGIKVVPVASGSSLTLGRAMLRTTVWAILAVPAGLGFLSALVGRDHRGLHDRFAGTRVVRAPTA
jgi:uncharacterized RDD family membrane protein YckC